jgi:hypothetical protein
MCHASRLVGNRDQHAVHVLRPIESCKHGRKRSARSFLLGNERPCIAREGRRAEFPYGGQFLRFRCVRLFCEMLRR